MSAVEKAPLSADELAAEGATALPDKEVASLLDLNADLDLAIDAAVGAKILSFDPTAQKLADQHVTVGSRRHRPP